MERIEGNPAAYGQLLNSINNVAQCQSEGLAVQFGAWGDLEAPFEFIAVYPLTTTDAARYGAALEEYAESISREAPGPIYYYQNRAGREDATHFVVFASPSLASLNEFLDNLTASPAYETFVGDVAEIRTLGTAWQSQRIAFWAP